MPEALLLRVATDADSLRIARFVAAALAEFSLTFEPDGHDADLRSVAGAYAGGAFLVVVDASDQIHGTGGVLPIGPDTMQIRKMYVAPSLRGLGWGRRILGLLLEEARARPDIRRITLETFHAMTAARALYERHGFRPVACQAPGPRCDMSYVLELGPGPGARPPRQ